MKPALRDERARSTLAHDLRRHRIARGHEDDRERRVGGGQRLDECEPALLPESHVDEGGIGPMLLGGNQSVGRAPRFVDDVSTPLQELSGCGPEFSTVVDDEYPQSLRHPLLRTY